MQHEIEFVTNLKYKWYRCHGNLKNKFQYRPIKGTDRLKIQNLLNTDN